MSQYQNLKYLTIHRELQKEIQSGALEEGSKLPTEYEISAKYGVSRPTVTKALNALRDEGFITRRKGSGSYVCARQDDLGLALTRLVGLIVPEPICARIAELSGPGRFSLIWGGAIEAPTDNEQLIALAGKYIEHRVAGVFFAPLEFREGFKETNRRVLALLETARIPVILLDADQLAFPERSVHDLVSIDHFRAAYELTHVFLRQGCGRVDFFHRPFSASSVALRVMGYRSALSDADITPRREWTHEESPEDVERVRLMVVDGGARNIICANDETAAALMTSLEAAGLAIPGDVRVIGFDDVRFAHLLKVPLTSYRQPCAEIAEEAVRLLLSRLARPDQGPRTVLTQGHVVERESSILPAEVDANTDAGAE